MKIENVDLFSLESELQRFSYFWEVRQLLDALSVQYSLDDQNARWHLFKLARYWVNNTPEMSASSLASLRFFLSQYFDIMS